MNKAFKFLQAMVLDSQLPKSVWHAPVKDRILDDLFLSDRNGCPEITTVLALPVGYIRLFLYIHGRELRVEIHPLKVSEDALQKRGHCLPPAVILSPCRRWSTFCWLPRQ